MVTTLPWPNIVTITRMALIFVAVMLVYGDSVITRLGGAALAVLIIIGDWLDGHLARKLNQTSELGSILDIVADRILENVMWIILADLNLIPVWIPVLVISRGILTDSIRNYTVRFGRAGFGEKTMMSSKTGKFLTGSPLMRTPYAIIKAFSFGWLLSLAALSEILAWWSANTNAWLRTGLEIGYWASVLAGVICIVRGVPVVIEGIALIRRETNNA